ncbi:MAG: AMP-binding protein [Actinobacteria bacterium]|nr:AMP-binding protein [Actinomycetota bacterium]
MLRDQVVRAGDRILLRTADRDWTRSEIDAASNRLARGLRGMGVDAGDRVLLMLENSDVYVIAWLALAKLGAIEVPVNTQYKGRLLAHLARTSGAETLIADPSMLDRFAALDDLAEVRRLVVNGSPADGVDLSNRLDVVAVADAYDTDDSELGTDPAYHDPVALMFTSGTTGPSKGVLVTHAHSYEYANSVRTALQLREDDVYYAPLPLFHIAGQWGVVYAALMSGGAAVVKTRFSVTEFWKDTRSFDASVSFLLGAMANFLHQQPTSEEDADNPLERMLVCPLIPELREFRRRFGVQVATAYGSTEANVPIYSGFEIADPSQCGRAREGWQVEIVDADDELLEPGEPGEIVVRPPEPWLTMRGYLGNGDATAEAYRNCWLHTGDMAYRDEDGNFYFVDRMSDAIRRRGENISSFEVEREVNAHPDVLESAAVGVPSDHSEEDVLVCVVAAAGASLQAPVLHSFLAENAPRFMVPRYIRVLDELPKTDTGKIKKAELREVGSAQAWDSETTAREEVTR